jgi:hypothetical protein
MRIRHSGLAAKRSHSHLQRASLIRAGSPARKRTERRAGHSGPTDRPVERTSVRNGRPHVVHGASLAHSVEAIEALAAHLAQSPRSTAGGRTGTAACTAAAAALGATAFAATAAGRL